MNLTGTDSQQKSKDNRTLAQRTHFESIALIHIGREDNPSIKHRMTGPNVLEVPLHGYEEVWFCMLGKASAGCQASKTLA